MNVGSLLRVGAIETVDRATGPGRFLTVWLQGCERNCPGCINSWCNDMEGGTFISVASICRILTSELDGICFTGGEPFLQAAALMSLAEYASSHNFGVVSYSGYTLEELRAMENPAVACLIEKLDILIDGPFIESESAVLLWRGSRNQRIHLLTKRYPDTVLQQPPVTAACLSGKGLSIVGMPLHPLNVIIDGLKDWGIDIRDMSHSQ